MALKWFREREWNWVFLVALVSRFLMFVLTPVDWDSDSYHHWQISYYTLKIGLGQGRMWDLTGSEYYWGMIPHLIQSSLMWLLRVNSIQLYRIFNVAMGSFNSVLVYKIAKGYYSLENARWSGLAFALFPISIVFDSVAMQDTVALTMFLSSLLVMREHFFVSGLLLGLACHSRVEYAIVSVLILSGFLMRERLQTDSQPYLFGWFVGWGVPTLHIYAQTGNPVYPLYWSLYSVFGGYTSTYKGQPFAYTMYRWLSSRSYIWTVSPSGLLIILFGASGLILIPWMAKRKWKRYQPQLYLVSTVMVMTPLVMPYFDSERLHLLLMMRFFIPITALGLPLLFHAISRLEGVNIVLGSSKILRVGVFLLLLSGFLVIPEYVALQGTVQNEFYIADDIAALYSGGRIVCDMPSVVYRLSNAHGVEPENIISNHYSPHYYGLNGSRTYLEWLYMQDVSIWTYYGDGGTPVWLVMEANYPSVFKNLLGEPGMGVYTVDRSVLDSLL